MTTTERCGKCGGRLMERAVVGQPGLFAVSCWSCGKVDRYRDKQGIVSGARAPSDEDRR